jgi:tetratricopeptide (TPR) repeat protein
MDHTSLKAKLLDLAQRCSADELAFVAALSEAERHAIGTPERWSAKDLIAHVAAWKQRAALMLAMARRGEVPPAFDDEDEFNARTFEENCQRAWDDVLTAAKRAVVELIAQVEPLTEADLVDPQRFPWRNGNPLWWPISIRGYGHPQMHLAQYHVEHGNLTRAIEIREALLPVRLSLDDLPSTRGKALYNLAGFYATIGYPEKALALLREALRFDATLFELSKHDADFTNLHDAPDYQALEQNGER